MIQKNRIEEGSLVRVVATNEIVNVIDHPQIHDPRITSITKPLDFHRWCCSNGRVYRIEELELIE